MAKVTPLHRSFISGEISKRLWSNSDIDIYKTGCSYCQNFTTTPQGSVRKRAGFEWVLSDNTDAQWGRVLGYPIDAERELAFVLFQTKLLVLRYITRTFSQLIGADNLTTYEPALPVTWTAFGDADTRITIPPSGNQAYFIHPDNLPHQAQRIGADAAADFEITEITFVAPPVAWVAGSYPTCGAFFQGRWWLAGSRDSPSTLWASKILPAGGYFDFTVGVNPDDALDIEMDDYGTIRWLKGLQNLVIGTDQGEFIMTSEGGVIHSADFKIEQQSAYGSTNSDAIRVGNSVGHITPDGRKIRETKYKFEEDAWTSRDLTFQAEHISEDFKLRTIVFQQNPTNTLWCVTRTEDEEVGYNSRLVACTFEKDLSIIGFHHHLVEGNMVDLAMSRYNGRDIPIGMVQRNIKNELILQLEIHNEDVYMDGYIKTVDQVVNGQISGMAHLAGNIVSAVLDGAVLPDVTVDWDGNSVIGADGSVLELGFTVHSTLRTLPMDYTNQTGSTPGWQKRWNSLFVRLIESHIPIINGTRPPTRIPEDPMDTPVPLIEDADVRITNLGYDNRGIIEVVSDLPLSCEISGVFGEMQQNQR